jgi:hypothetical protein
LEVGYSWLFVTVVTDGKRTRTETDGGGIADTSRALLRAGRPLEQVRFKETITNEKVYTYIKYDFGMLFQQKST